MKQPRKTRKRDAKLNNKNDPKYPLPTGLTLEKISELLKSLFQEGFNSEILST